MAVMGAPETAVEWTKPGGIAFDPAEPFRGLAQVEGGYPVLMMDCQVNLISPQTSPRDMAGLVTYDGHEVGSVALKPWR